ncbi:SIS domain-containing protein [Leptospira kmetyi]|uniref:SIS domain-containing protein n=1 Tax=Leptospira kmetyi TaxID=408139 RepID=A0A5F1XY42_9LEPT|nr:SIS domain-containing protein [Leptospira kmetyi]AYV57220.1 SIS domain-containing protein [Leptospira kmetyi]TGK21417.1 SIS domain-containing protein [Leptospira kmetyi]TGK28344.1 SIS domain-containing protein [Leptospira kmetyi]TGL68289.1 SIS domain-containing protein [Leptospira kmetyi]
MNNIDRFYTKDPVEFAGAYLKYLQTVLQNVSTVEIGRFIETLLDARKRGATIFFIGNGGSAATASHFANDISIGTNEYETPFRALSLTDNVSIISAIGNDFGYEDIFVRQLKVLGKKGDVLVAISASGNSPNLLKAIEYANGTGIKSIAITAFDGGKMKTMANEGIHVPTDLKEYGPAEDAHMVLDHLVGAFLMRYIKQN